MEHHPKKSLWFFFSSKASDNDVDPVFTVSTWKGKTTFFLLLRQRVLTRIYLDLIRKY